MAGKFSVAKWHLRQLMLDLPQRIVIAGPSATGKTRLAKKLVEHADLIFSTEFDRIILVYSEFQTIYSSREKDFGVELHTDIPEEVSDYNEETLLIQLRQLPKYKRDSKLERSCVHDEVYCTYRYGSIGNLRSAAGNTIA